MSLATPRISALQRLAWVPLFVAVAAFAGLAVFRARALENDVGSYTNCRGCFWLSSLGHDAWLFALVLVLLAAGYALRWSSARLLGRIVACLLLLAFAGDIATNALLSQRLYLLDLLRFGKHASDDLSVIRAALGSRAGRAGAAVGLLVLLASIGIVGTAARRPRLGAVAAVSALLFGGFSVYAITRQVHYVHDLFLDNVVEANLPQGRVSTYSQAYLDRQPIPAAPPDDQCSAGTPTNGNVIVLLVESLSAWQSHLLGSTEDWTPKLDGIARANHYFRNFYANGFTTSTGEIAVLAGRTPLIPPGKTWFDFSDYLDADGSLPDIAHRSGGDAAFFTTGDVSFLGLGDWLQRIGFDVVDGSKDSFYDGRKRWQFGAADDASLYERFLKWLDGRDPQRPFVSAMLTVSSHPPYVDPRTAKIDPEASFRYVDEQIAHFHDELQKRGYFKNGLLLVLGDHRTMTPLHEDEFRAWGERAYARIPLIVIGATDMPAVVDGAFQQTDIAPSIGEWMGLRECHGTFGGLFLRADPKPADNVLHVRGDNRNRVDVYHGAELGGFLLDGDRSTWIESAPPDAVSVAGWIARQREATRVRADALAQPIEAAKP